MNIYLKCAEFLETLEDHEGDVKPAWFVFWENFNLR